MEKASFVIIIWSRGRGQDQLSVILRKLVQPPIVETEVADHPLYALGAHVDFSISHTLSV